MEYGADAPGAPDVFVNDAQFRSLWLSQERYYLVGDRSAYQRLIAAVGESNFHEVAASGGKFVWTNHPASVTRGDEETGNKNRAVASFVEPERLKMNAEASKIGPR